MWQRPDGQKAFIEAAFKSFSNGPRLQQILNISWVSFCEFKKKEQWILLGQLWVPPLKSQKASIFALPRRNVGHEGQNVIATKRWWNRPVQQQWPHDSVVGPPRNSKQLIAAARFQQLNGYAAPRISTHSYWDSSCQACIWWHITTIVTHIRNLCVCIFIDIISIYNTSVIYAKF